MSKALRKQGAEVLSEKKYPLPVNGLHSGLKTGHRGASLRKQGAGACWKKEHPVIGYQWTTMNQRVKVLLSPELLRRIVNVGTR